MPRKRVQDNSQLALFEMAPEPKRRQVPVPTIPQKPKIKSKPKGVDKVMMIIGYKDGEERFHESCPSSWVDHVTKFNKDLGYKVEVIEISDYWRDWHKGIYKLGHA